LKQLSCLHQYQWHWQVGLLSEFGVTGETITSLGDNNIVGFGDSATLTGWQTDNTNGLIEANRDSAYGVGGESRGTVIELERYSGEAGNIYQELDIRAGDTIQLTFDLSARANRGGEDSAVNVMWEGQIVEHIVPNVGWESYTYTFTATTDNPRLELDAPTNNGGQVALLV
jgi:hypothetical protein